MLEDGDYFIGGLDGLTADELPRVEPLLQYWATLANNHGSPPPASSFDILEVAETAHWHMVVDVVNLGQDYVFRLIGTNLHPLIGSDITGRNIRALEQDYPEVHKRGMRLYSDVFAHGEPIATRWITHGLEHDSPATVVTCAVPLSGKDGTIAKIAQITRIRAQDGRWLD